MTSYCNNPNYVRTSLYRDVRLLGDDTSWYLPDQSEMCGPFCTGGNDWIISAQKSMDLLDTKINDMYAYLTKHNAALDAVEKNLVNKAKKVISEWDNKWKGVVLSQWDEADLWEGSISNSVIDIADRFNASACSIDDINGIISSLDEEIESAPDVEDDNEYQYGKKFKDEKEAEKEGEGATTVAKAGAILGFGVAALLLYRMVQTERSGPYGY